MKDVRFDAAHALRLIGYVLSLKGHDCAALYDEDDPYADILGARADADICEAAVRRRNFKSIHFFYKT